jgi:hypothetical protein
MISKELAKNYDQKEVKGKYLNLKRSNLATKEDCEWDPVPTLPFLGAKKMPAKR